MDRSKYRKWYLSENWGENKFYMIKKINPKSRTEIARENPLGLYHGNGYRNPEKAFWINDYELCIGYALRENLQIFRPIFSYKRQQILDKVNKAVYNNRKFWNKVKSKYFYSLCNIKKLPIECVKHIVLFTSK